LKKLTEEHRAGWYRQFGIDSAAQLAQRSEADTYTEDDQEKEKNLPACTEATRADKDPLHMATY